MSEGRDFAAASTVGARARQEDDWGTHVNPPAREPHARLLAAVADGMGGMPAGDRASGIALRAFLDSYRAIDLPAAERLRHALAHANREVGIAAEADPEVEGMGCTLVAALFFRDRCEWLSVGDSLILLIRDGDLKRVNPLHVYANELDERVRQGELSEEAARKDPERAALTSAIQGTVLEEVAQGVLALEAGDVLILASDGILTLTNEEIVSTCAEHAEHGAESVVRAIVGRIDAAERANQDNATLVAVCHDAAAGDEDAVPDEEWQGAKASGEKAGEDDAEMGKTLGQREPVSLQDELRVPAAPANTTGLEKAAKPIAGSDAAGGIAEKERREHGRKRALVMRLAWLTAAFVLGAFCGAIGWRILYWF